MYACCRNIHCKMLKIAAGWLVFVLLVTLYAFPVLSDDTEWLSGWLYRRQITIDSSLIDENLIDFPVVVKLNNSNFDFTKAASDGYDIRFTGSNGETLLSYERERHNSGSEEAEYWVKIPVVSHVDDTDFYIYYGNSGVADGAQTDVWDANYVGVWHKDDYNATTIKDSAGVNDGTKNAEDESLEVEGKIGRAQEYAKEDQITVSHDETLNISGEITLSAWVNPSGWQYRKRVTIEGQNSAGEGYQVPLLVGESSGSPGADFHLEGNSESFPSGEDNGGDLRFTGDDGTTLLSFWVEDVDGTSPNRTALIWVKIGEDLENDQDIYCCYGNPEAANASSGEDTFNFFDDFTGDLSDWSRDKTSGDYPEIPDGQSYVRLGGGTAAGEFGHTSLGTSPSFEDFLDNAVEVRIRQTADSIGEVVYRGDYSANSGYKGRWDARDGDEGPFMKPPYYDWAEYGTNDPRFGDPSGEWFRGTLTVSGSNHAIYKDGVQMDTWTDNEYTASGEVALQNHFGDWTDFDFVAVREFVSPEPSFSSAGNEEEDVPVNVGTILGKGCDAYHLKVDGNFNIAGYINDEVISSSGTQGAWQHVALTYNGATRYMYIDGVLAESEPLSGAIDTNTENLLMGTDFAGFIDEVRISDTARSAAWLKAQYHTGNNSLLTYVDEEQIPVSVSITSDHIDFGSMTREETKEMEGGALALSVISPYNNYDISLFGTDLKDLHDPEDENHIPVSSMEYRINGGVWEEVPDEDGDTTVVNNEDSTGTEGTDYEINFRLTIPLNTVLSDYAGNLTFSITTL